jgi:hypothetical protein
MNCLIKEQIAWLNGMQQLRSHLLDILTDANLTFSLPGNLSLGDLFRQQAEVERSYADSFKTFQQTFEHDTSDPALATDVAKLKAYFQTVDADLVAALEALFEEDLERSIERGFPITVRMQFGVYYQALLIFFGKVSIYYRAMPLTLPEKWKDWFG